MGTNTISQLERSETTMESWITLLQKIDKMLVCFLGDEGISLAQPLTSIPIWSANPAGAWELVYFDIGDVGAELTGNIRANPTWFKWSVEDQMAFHQKDWDAREHLIAAPDVKLQVPNDNDTFNDNIPKVPQTPIPSQIIKAPIEPSGTCVAMLTSLERVKDGVSSLKFGFYITGSISEGLEKIVINCGKADDRDPVQLVDLSWNGLRDVPTSSKLRPPRPKPRLKTSVVERKAEWIIARPIFHWNFSFPRNFTLSVDVAYKSACTLIVDLILVYRGMRNKVTFGAMLELPEGTTSTTSKPP